MYRTKSKTESANTGSGSSGETNLVSAKDDINAEYTF